MIKENGSKTSRTIFHSITVATFLLVTNPTLSRSENKSKTIDEFLIRNPRINHQQFRGKIINVLYSCTPGRSSSKIEICKNIDISLKNLTFIKFIKTTVENPYGINFLVTHKNYTYSIYKYYIEGCGKQMSGQTVIFVNDGIKSDIIKRCVNISTLNHLGFDVSSLAENPETDIDIEKLLSFYVK